MIGQVDFNKDMDFWQLDKWNGFFPVKWHVVKDVPNAQLRQIILENNENKPVTHSRDTQEVLHFYFSWLMTFKLYMLGMLYISFDLVSLFFSSQIMPLGCQDFFFSFM